MSPAMRIAERLQHKRPVFSFEFFPPKTEKGETVLWRSLERLALLEPDFVSVTYGAGGSTRTRTLEIVSRIKQRIGIEPLAHLTCVGATRDELTATVDKLGELGIENILALRGDPPKGEENFRPVDGGLSYASDLVALIRERGPFCVGAACYPEVHQEAKDAATDLQNLKTKVDAGVDFLVSQMFFDNGRFGSFVDRARGVGIDVPILAGVMPVTNVAQIERMAKMSGAFMPDRLLERLRAVDGDPHEVFWTGVSYAAQQCRALLQPRLRDAFEAPRPPVEGIHFYTLNKSPATRAIFEILQLSRGGL